MEQYEVVDELARARFARENTRIAEVLSELQASWDALSAVLREKGISAEGLGCFWWLQVETAMAHMQAGALYARHGVSHPWLHQDFRNMQDRREEAIASAAALFELRASGAPN